MVLAWQLITRHRAPRLALVLVATLVALLKVERDPLTLAARQHGLVLIAGILSSIAASRLTSRGAALGSIRRVSSAWWVPTMGRLCGALCFVLLPVVLAAGILLPVSSLFSELPPLLAITLPYLAVMSSLVMALTPMVGASAGATVGLLVNVGGAFPPSHLSALLERWPHLEVGVVSVWKSLPLSWHVSHWLVLGGTADPLVLAVWVAFGIAGTAWITTRTPRSLLRVRDV